MQVSGIEIIPLFSSGIVGWLEKVWGCGMIVRRPFDEVVGYVERGGVGTGVFEVNHNYLDALLVRSMM